jgi:peptidoglycan/xylan/chitin deacetylase (PgdA/CDA1 family)
MRRIFIILQLFLVAALITFVIYIYLKPEPPLDYNPASWHSRQGFFALSYTGIDKKGEEGYISRKLLKDHLSALKEAGYKTVTPEDALAYLRKEAPLPDKAVLLLFEGGRKDSFLYATPLLQKYGMIATMCIPTSVVNTWGGFYLKEDDLENLSRRRQWRLCSMGERTIREIPINNSGRKGHFLTQRLWTGKGPETTEAFQTRLSHDYANADRLLEQISGKKITAYLYPFADAGTGKYADAQAAEINLSEVMRYHQIAFVSADSPFNSFFKNPFSLSRLRVRNNWTGRDLIRELELFKPRQSSVEGLRDESIWYKNGGVSFNNHTLLFSPGSFIWLRGTERWSDLDVIAELKLETNASAIFSIRYENDNSFLHLVVERHKISFNERMGNTSQTLVHSRINDANGKYKVRIRLKGNRAWVWNNDKLIAGQIPISASVTNGRIGISCQNNSVELLDFKAIPLRKVFLFADRYQAIPPLVQDTATGLLPVWFSLDIRPRVDDRQYIDLLKAASSGVEIIPIVDGKGDISQDAADKFADAVVSAISRSPIKPLITRLAIYGLDNKLSDAFHKRGYSIVRLLSPEQGISFIRKRQALDNDLLLIKGSGKECLKTIDGLLHFIPPDHLVVVSDVNSPVPEGVGLASVYNQSSKGIQ